MFEPIVRKGRLKSSKIDKLYGINETSTIQDCEFSDMMNMDGEFPYLKTRCHRQSVDAVAGEAKNIVSIENEDDIWLFTGVAEVDGDNKLYYKNEVILLDGNEEYSIIANSIVTMGEKLIIFPDKLIFDPNNDKLELEDMAKSKAISSAKFYGSTDKNDVVTNYILGSDINCWSDFEKGDSVIISSCSKEKNNTIKIQDRANAIEKDDIISVVVEKIDEKRLYLLCYNSSGIAVEFDSVTSDVIVQKDIPDMNYICEHNNRIWGTGTDGKFIYASKLGDPTNYNCFSGLSTDSWWSEVATNGAFTSIVSFQNHVYAFKRDCLHEIYGDKPSNFKMPYITKTGCVDDRSIVEMQSVMFFASTDGVYSYSGGIPKRISDNISFKCTRAVGGRDHKYLYMSLDNVVYKYDIYYDIWYKEGHTMLNDIYYTGENVCFASYDGILIENSENEYVKWNLTTKEFVQNSVYNMNIVNLWVKTEIAKNAHLRVYISIDGQEFKEQSVVYGQKRVSRIGIRLGKCERFQIRFQGMGDVKFYGFEIDNYIGGKNI